jgi:hypothetical protein
MINLKKKGFLTFDEVLEKVSQINNKIDVLELSENSISVIDLDRLPEQFKHINLSNNSIKNILWGRKKWGTLKLSNNGLDYEMINGVTCEKLDLTDNFISDITFIHCEIGELILTNNSLKEINFIECKIRKLNLSLNKLTEITNLPEGIVELNASSNKIHEIFDLPNSIMFIDLSENLLKSLPNIPENIFKLDLSYNKFKTFNISTLPESLDYFDITNNQISNAEVIFDSIKNKIDTIYYDEEKYNQINESIRNSTTDGNIEKIGKQSPILLTDNNDDKENVSDTDTDEISLNIISKKASRISFDSFESINSNDLNLDSDTEEIDELISDYKLNKNNHEDFEKYDNEENFYKSNGSSNHREILWIPKIESESDEDEDQDSSESDDSDINNFLSSDVFDATKQIKNEITILI